MTGSDESQNAFVQASISHSSLVSVEVAAFLPVLSTIPLVVEPDGQLILYS